LKIAVLFNQFGPYHYARLNALGILSNLYGIEFFSKSDIYEWKSVGFESNISFIKRTLFNLSDPSTVSKNMLAKNIFEILDDVDPDVVAINGWSESGAFAALKWCLLHKKPAIAMSESTEHDRARSRIKELIKSQIVKKFSSALVGGTPHREYMSKLGMPVSNIFEKYDVVDNEYFFSTTSKIRKNSSFHRQRWGLPEKFFLASARFVSKKNLEGLIQAYAFYKAELKDAAWSLVILGDGHLRQSFTNLIAELDISEQVLMPGFKQYDELPYYYALAKAFIHPSISEQWGLVVNEAMASALPILVSNRCGCSYDLVQHEINGLIFNPYEVSDISQKMMLLSSGQYDLSCMSQRSLEIIADFTPSHFANNLLFAATKALGEKKSFGLLNALTLNYLIRK
jgi:glycosyltransferase involved in cell wall biosynthesis